MVLRFVAQIAKCKSVQLLLPAYMLKWNNPASFSCSPGLRCLRLECSLCSTANLSAFKVPACTATCSKPSSFLFLARRLAPFLMSIFATSAAISGSQLKFMNTKCIAVLPCSFGTLTSSSTDSSGVFSQSQRFKSFNASLNSHCQRARCSGSPYLCEYIIVEIQGSRSKYLTKSNRFWRSASTNAVELSSSVLLMLKLVFGRFMPSTAIEACKRQT